MVIVIAGPTASGKSEIALRLAKDIDAVIINGDSRQIYKELQIGTSRPLENEFGNIPHYLFGHVSITEDYNIYKYQRDVKRVLEKLPSNKIPIIVGGTGLYIDSVIYNYKLQGSFRTQQSRTDLENLSIKKLQSLIDEDTLRNLNESDIVNPVRLRRIIEKGKLGNQKGEKLNCLYFVIDVDKQQLEENIKQRVNQMFENGLLEENAFLRKNGIFNSTVLKIIGYKEFQKYFDGTETIEVVKNGIVRNTKRYAKRQRTWFRRNRETIWTNSYDLILESSLRFINTE